jgi:putative flippase GtrA
MFKKIFDYFWSRIFWRFAFSGGIATLTDIILLYILTEYLNIWYLVSSVFSFLVGSLTHFTISRYWVFQNLEKSYWRQYASFFLIHLGGLIINVLGLYLLVEFVGIYYIIAKLLVVVLGVSWTFWGNKKFTFKIN